MPKQVTLPTLWKYYNYIYSLYLARKLFRAKKYDEFFFCA